MLASIDSVSSEMNPDWVESWNPDGSAEIVGLWIRTPLLCVSLRRVPVGSWSWICDDAAVGPDSSLIAGWHSSTWEGFSSAGFKSHQDDTGTGIGANWGRSIWNLLNQSHNWFGSRPGRIKTRDSSFDGLQLLHSLMNVTRSWDGVELNHNWVAEVGIASERDGVEGVAANNEPCRRAQRQLNASSV